MLIHNEMILETDMEELLNVLVNWCRKLSTLLFDNIDSYVILTLHSGNSFLWSGYEKITIQMANKLTILKPSSCKQINFS